MATSVAVLNSERWLDEILFQANLPADVMGAAVEEDVALPALFGDVAILSVVVRATGVDVGPASVITPRGVLITVVDATGSTSLDLVGAAPWMLVKDTANALQFAANVDPDALTLWRQHELLHIWSPEMDSDATPTGDAVVYIKAVRVRPIQVPASPLQLVR